LYSSPNVIRKIKPTMMRWAGQEVNIGRWEMRTKFWLESLKRRDHSEYIAVYGKIMLKVDLKEIWLESVGRNR
jgi:hypothetical protein